MKAKSRAFMILFLSICMVLLPGLLGHSGHASADDVRFDAIRAKWAALLMGEGEYSVPVTDPTLQTKLSLMDAAVTSCPTAAPCTSGSGIWDLMNRDTVNRSYLWSDLDFVDSNIFTVSGHIATSYSRLLSMIVPYYTPGTALYHNATLLADVTDALDWLYANKYNTTVSAYGNWFHWQIGAPKALTRITAIMYDDLTPTQIANYMNAVNRFTPTPTSKTVVGSPTMTGANLADQTYIVALRGVIVQSDSKLTTAKNALSALFPYVSSGDGFYTDGSFIQHNNDPYIGAYGESLVVEVGELLYVLDGSDWEVTDSNRMNVYKWIFDSIEPFVYQGYNMDSVRGRTITFGPPIVPLDRRLPYPRFTGLSNAVLFVSLTAPDDNLSLGSRYPVNPKLTMQGIIKYWLSQDPQNTYLEKLSSIFQYEQVTSILDDSAVPSRGELVRYKQFPNMDRAVQTRPGYGFALSMSSKRISNYESGNNDNIQGWYTGDGMTYLYNDDVSQIVDFWPTVNRYRLPGTTIDTQTRTEAVNWDNYKSPKTWVGGTSLGDEYGVSGMDYKASGDIKTGGEVLTPSNLTAKKSWFLFDDEMVALGAGITNSGQTGNGWDGLPRRVETVVDNRKLLESGANSLIVDGASQPTTLGWSDTLPDVTWMSLQGNTAGNASTVGYYFPNTATVQATRESRTGSWSDVDHAYPTSNTIPDAADTFVLQGDPNHGSEPTMTVHNGAGSQVSESYLTFDLSHYVPDNTLIGSAIVQIVPTAKGPTTATIENRAELVEDAWSESLLDWTNKPLSAPLDPVQNWTNITVGSPISINVTNAVQAAMAPGGSKRISLRIYASSSVDADGWVSYAAKENTSSAYRPQLVLTDYKEQMTGNYMTMTLDHGTNPTNETYAYALLPGKDSSAMEAYAASPDIRILANAADVQAVQEKTLNMVGANFWNDTTTTVQLDGQAFLTSDKKASVMVKENPGVDLEVSVSDPTMLQTGNINLEINRTAFNALSLDSGVQVLQTSPTIKLSIDVNGAKGKTFHVKLNTGTPPEPANAKTVQIAPAADTYVRDGTYANDNYGMYSTLYVKKDGVGYTRKSYLQFDLSSLTGIVHSATMKLVTRDAGPTTINHEARLVSDHTWTETGLKWNNQPSAGDLIDSWTVPAPGSSVEINVTDQVYDAMAGDQKLAIQIAAPNGVGSDGWMTYGSKDNANVDYRPVLVVQLVPLTAAAVTASSDDGNIPTNTIDQNISTRWSAEGDGEWIQYDLGSNHTLQSVGIAWYSGDVRTASFDVQVSTDGVNFTTIYSGASSGTTTDIESYDVPDTTARYVRIIGHGNSHSMWNSITETELWGN